MTRPTRSSRLTARRRIQTARDIQNEALRLALEHGFAHVTTAMIADAAGVSLRTFFNYYANKEAALAGEPLRFGDFDLDWFCTSKNPLLPDLERLLFDLLEGVETSGERLRQIDQLCETEPKLKIIFMESVKGFVDDLSDLLVRRMGEEFRMAAELLAELVGRALMNAFQQGARTGALTTVDVVHLTISQLTTIGRILADD